MLQSKQNQVIANIIYTYVYIYMYIDLHIKFI